LKIEFKNSFARDLKGIRDHALKREVRQVIEKIEAAQSLQEVADVKKLRGGDRYYRIKVGDYRVGVVVQGSTVVFVRFLHRKDVYKYFP